MVPTCMDLSIGGRARAWTRKHLYNSRDEIFTDGFGWEVVSWVTGFFGMMGKAGKILFLLNRSSKMVPTRMDLSIGGRARRGSKNIHIIPGIRFLRTVSVGTAY